MGKNYSRSSPLTICQNKILVDLRAIGEDSFLRMSGTLPDLFQETTNLELLFPRVCNNGKKYNTAATLYNICAVQLVIH